MPVHTQLYEKDFVQWAEQQADALRRAARAGSNMQLDWDNLAEEIESLGKSQRRELRSRIANVIEHLIKLDYSPALEPREGWAASVRRERQEIEALLEDSPSLRSDLDQIVQAE